MGMRNPEILEVSKGDAIAPQSLLWRPIS